MDFIHLAVLILIGFCGYSVQGSSLEVSSNVTSVMGSQAALTCKYTSAAITNVVIIRWSKYSDDGKNLYPVAMRRLPTGRAEFLSTTPEHLLEDHSRLMSTLLGESVTLDLVIDALKCEDIGRYECSVVDIAVSNPIQATSQVNIEVHPKTPTFTTEELQVTVNTSFELRCRAEVGTPPHVIAFSYKAPGTNIYTLVKEGVTTEVKPDPARCTNMAVSTLQLVMTEEMDNAQYMCSLAEAQLGADGTPKNFDEIKLKVYSQTTTTTTTEPPRTSSEKAAAISDDGGSGMALSASLPVVFCSLLAGLLVTCRRSTS